MSVCMDGSSRNSELLALGPEIPYACRMRLTVCALAAILALPSLAWSQSKKVVLVHSYQNDYEWTRLQASGVLSELESATDLRLQVKIEYLDAKRSWNAEKERASAASLSASYRDYGADIVIVTDNDALDFLDRYGDGIFGRVPIVFSGVNDFSEAMIANRREYRTGVVEFVDFDSTLAAIRSLFPSVDEVRVLADESSTGAKTRLDFVAAIERSGFSLPVSSFPAVPFEEVLSEAASLPRSTAVVLLSYARDPGDMDRPIQEIVARLAGSAAGPVFSFWDFNFGYGIVGGALTSGFAQGREAGRIALRILRGESVGSIPVAEIRHPELTFDWRVLKRFGIHNADLPIGSIVRFRPQGLYERDPKAFMVVVATVTVSMAVIAILSASLVVVIRARSRLAAEEKLLSAAFAEQSALLHEVHHRVNNNFQVISSLLSLQRGAVDDPAACSALQESENRVRSMALVHERFYSGGTFASIDIIDYLVALFGSLALKYPGSEGRIDLRTPGEPLDLDLDTAVSIGLIFNELFVNSFSFAFPDGRRGTIAIGLSSRAGPGGETGTDIAYSDDGVGLPDTVDFNHPSRLGFQLIHAAASQAKASVVRDGTFGPPGTRFVVSLGKRGGA